MFLRLNIVSGNRRKLIGDKTRGSDSDRAWKPGSCVLADGRVLIYSPAPLNEGGASDKSLLGDFR